MSSETTEERQASKSRMKWHGPAAFLITALLSMRLTAQPENAPMPAVVTGEMVFVSVMMVQGTLLVVVLFCLALLGYDSDSRTAELHMDRFDDHDVVRGAVYGVLGFLVVLGVATITDHVAERFGIPLVPDDPWGEMIARSTFGGKLMVGLATLVAAPVVEEIVFRHTLYRAVKMVSSHWFAAIASAAAFAIAHDNVAGLPAFFVFALMLQRAYRQTGRLYVPITMHATFNAFMLTFSQWYT